MSAIPVVFVHGLWMHASSWDPWLELFEERGYAPVAPPWPGDADTAAATRADPGAMAGVGLEDVVASYVRVVDALPALPLVVGHSFGGLVAERLLAAGRARGCVALSPAQFRGILGLPLAQLQSAWPVLSRPSLRKGTWAHTAETYARSFANAVPRAESDELFDRYAIPGPGRPLFQAGLANLARRSPAAVDTRAARGPLLLVAAGRDRTVPAATVRAAYAKQRRNAGTTELRTLPDRGHSFPVDNGWREVAELALDFASRHGLGAAPVLPGQERRTSPDRQVSSSAATPARPHGET